VSFAPEPVAAVSPTFVEDEVETGSLWPEVAAAAEISAERPTIRIIDPSVAEEEDDLYLAAAPASREPAIVPPPYAQEQSAADAASEEDYEPAHRAEPKKGPWLSLFGGRPRYDAPTSASRGAAPPPSRGPAPRPASHGGAAQAVAQAPAEAPENNEDLDIPSFLRRLAN
jgi:cell division protein FtsZ